MHVVVMQTDEKLRFGHVFHSPRGGHHQLILQQPFDARKSHRVARAIAFSPKPEATSGAEQTPVEDAGSWDDDGDGDHGDDNVYI